MSHELRTPLTAIIGYTRLLTDELSRNNTEALKRDISTVEFSARHLLGLINNTLDLSKIEAGKMEVRCEHFDPRPVLTECAKMFGPLFQEKDNRLVVEVEDLPPALHSDRAKLRQILFNLLSNAGKFTDGGTITLRSRTENQQLILEVIDTGSGMDPEQLKRAFEPFESNLGNHPEEGTGLGLTIVQAFCRLLHGSLEFESIPNRGTTCRVRLPFTQCESK
jgi:signal transduction histidine kinase